MRSRVYRDPRVLIGFEKADDAGVYLLDEKTALVQTVDFFTPVVDDPFCYGQIAAANSLSDIYAMGGSPLYALSIVGFPEGNLDESILGEIMSGGADKLAEVKVPIIGGHSVQDKEMKFGYTITGRVDPTRIYTNSGAKEGDSLVLTKPLGTGIITTGVKFGKTPEDVLEEAIRWMLTLND
ncbi:MAG TPA: selenide, water dikinase SelD, partial [Acidobacteriota bacterium]|nr:selenide, water dikinase SelD [Acidobacteriota bacterium]